MISELTAPERTVCVDEFFEKMRRSVLERTDRNFALLMILQFAFGVFAAVWISPRTWIGVTSQTYLHVWAAVLLGGLITSLPVFLTLAFPGRVLTRHVVATGQMLMGALLIHLMGGRIETHFHIFGSLAFLAFYRDWKVLVTATLVIAIDHYLRGVYWPQSVFNLTRAEPFRWLEHVGWVLFEDLFLWVSIGQSLQQTRMLAQRQCDLEAAKMAVESERDRFFELSLDMLCVANLEGYFVRVNPMFPLKLGYRSDELTSRPFIDFVHPDDREETLTVLSQLGQGGDVIDFENRYRRYDGEYLWLSWSSRAVAEHESLVYAVARDVTSRKRAALALQEAKQTAEQARAAAEQANRAKSDFLANMSHEIRTPMNAVLGLTELVLESKLTPLQRDYLSTVLESGESLMSIINEILDFSKIEAGKIVLESAPLNLREELGDMMKSLGVRAHAKQLELVWHVDAEVPPCVVGDSVRLRQILVNLIGNAIKFTPSGEVVLNVHSHRRQKDSVDLCFEVADTGVGIPADKLEAIFAKFEQADTSTTREFGGTGLGLSIASRLVELMGGRIEVETELRKGSKFRFTVPLEVLPESLAISPRTDVGVLDGMHVLIVDDSSTNRRILQEMVKSWGMRPSTASSGAEAIERLKELHSSGQTPAVVLTDVNMPSMDGSMLAERIRRSPDLPDPAVVALTSGERIADPGRREELGIAAELLKPVKQSELLQTILRAIAPLAEETADADRLSEPSKETSSLRVLLAEDGLANQMLAVGLLKKWGHEVTVAQNGREVIRLWEADDFDLILMDVQMPELDGISATKIIRQLEQERGDRIPIIALTAHALKGDRERCLEAGMDGYVSKPMKKHELSETIQSFFAK